MAVIKLRIYFAVFCVVFQELWIINGIYCEKDLTTCSFHYWKMDWHSAAHECEREDKQLLCYRSRRDVDDIAEAFRLSADMNASLDIWLRNKNCSSNRSLECLSLHIAKSHDRMWHFFQENCEDQFPFICCYPHTDISSSSSSSPTTSVTTSIPTTSIKNTTYPQVSSSSPLFSGCRTTKRRNLKWPDTSPGKTAFMSCPGHSTGKAEWTCNRNNQWSIEGPNLKKCRSLDLPILKEKFNTSTLPEVLSLIEDTMSHREMFGEDLVDVISLMTSLPGRVIAATNALSPPLRWTKTRDYVKRSAAIFDRVVELSDTWQDVSKSVRPSVGTMVLSAVDKLGLLLADSLEQQHYTVSGHNMALQVTKVRQSASLEMVSRVTSQHGGFFLEQGYDTKLQLMPQKGQISALFVFYSDLSHILSSSLRNESALNSGVVSAVVAQGGQPVSITGSITILVDHVVPNRSSTCVFWNTENNYWATNGCYLAWSNATWSACVCDHLTNFAILMDYQGEVEDTPAFHYITLIGCSLSIICLIICVVVFSCYSYQSTHSWSLRYTIHRNLCLTLLVANLLLVLGFDQTQLPGVCSAVAGLLHYFLLSAFCWMLLEAVHIYFLLVVVFAQRHTHTLKYYLFGYGFPLFIVTVTAISRPNYYGTDKVCWLSIEKGTIWAFMAPVACILTLNTAALVLAQWKASSVSIKNDNMVLFKRWLRVTFILFPVLGITWVFGFLYVGEQRHLVAYLFAFLNTLQGFCIFICHCLMDKNARTMMLDSFKKKSTSVVTVSSNTQQRRQQKSDNSNANGSTTVQQQQPESLNSNHNWFVRRLRKPWSFFFEVAAPEPEVGKVSQT